MDLYENDDGTGCDNCKFWAYIESVEEKLRTVRYGFCKRYAPRPILGKEDKKLRVIWPVIEGYWGCGDYVRSEYEIEYPYVKRPEI